jgi:hypothetical protein
VEPPRCAAAAHAQWNLLDAQLLEGEVQEDFLGVGEAAEQMELRGGVSPVAAHAARDVVKCLSGEAGDQAREHPIAQVFETRHLRRERGVEEARRRGEIGASFHHGGDQRRNVCGIELPVGVDAHHQVGAGFDAFREGGVEGGADAPCRPVAKHASARVQRLPARGVAAAVVDHEDVHLGDARDRARHAAHHVADGAFLVESRDAHQETQAEGLRAKKGNRRFHQGDSIPAGCGRVFGRSSARRSQIS